MRYIHLLAVGFFLGNFSCSMFRGGSKKNPPVKTKNIEVYGHRGEAGHYPENSVAGFLSAVQKGVQAIEMDVVISADEKVVVSHEPYMASEYVADPKGKRIIQKNERSYNIFRMHYDSIRKYDGGSMPNKNFPKQRKMKTYKPLLEEVIDSVENFTSSRNLTPVKYMIEIKSEPRNYNQFQPEPEKFADLVMEVIIKKEILNRAIINSFDPLLLNTLREKYPEVEISYLVRRRGIEHNLSRLNFSPEIYSPHYIIISNKNFVDSVQSRNMKLIPWTVNKKRSIKQLINLGVDGIITDYPEKVFKALKKH